MKLEKSFHPLSGFSSYLSYPLEATIQATSKGRLRVKQIYHFFLMITHCKTVYNPLAMCIVLKLIYYPA